MTGKKTDYQKMILGILAITGMLMVAVIAPNCMQLLDLIPKQKHRRLNYINKVIGRLEDQRLLKVTKNKDGVRIARLTDLGRKKLKEYHLKDLQIKRPKKWDGKYRVIIFDIKEWKRSTRNKLRRWFEQLGLMRLQNSVWVYPYDCEEIIALLKANYHIGNEVLYMEVNRIENDRRLKEVFGLIWICYLYYTPLLHIVDGRLWSVSMVFNDLWPVLFQHGFYPPDTGGHWFFFNNFKLGRLGWAGRSQLAGAGDMRAAAKFFRPSGG